MNRVLLLEPYYGGSHKLFLQNLQKNIAADYLGLFLPARKWKMRMQLSALWFFQELEKLPVKKRGFETVLLSTFVDLAVFKSLVFSLPGWNKAARFCTYFHENQFAYPNQITGMSNHQFTAINFNTALLSDCNGFNSLFNKESFLSGAADYLKKATDMDLRNIIPQLEKKCLVLHPGLYFDDIDHCQSKKVKEAVIVWNHRWEHDKNPELFFDTLYSLQDQGVPFKVIVLGQAFINRPKCFQEAELILADRILHFGYVKSRKEYLQFLCQGDIVVSTARHEFFGISVLEAVRAGCSPLLPDDLSYPELFDKQYLYQEGQLETELKKLLQGEKGLDSQESRRITDRFQWHELKASYGRFLFE